ncbi:glycosyltransferase [Candidatus Villigracilis saccharophilus]|uniref:glycosyltransferase n=1 Tax=Candidatus Villigracilis saccharophilus TaxID=3140684 RepID=UPI0031EB5161
MKITILTYGSRGDVQPFVALALGLQKNGHVVKLAALHKFNEFVTSHGITFIPLAGDPEEISRLINNAGTNPARVVASMWNYIFSIAPQVSRVAFPSL